MQRGGRNPRLLLVHPSDLSQGLSLQPQYPPVAVQFHFGGCVWAAIQVVFTQDLFHPLSKVVPGCGGNRVKLVNPSGQRKLTQIHVLYELKGQ